MFWNAIAQLPHIESSWPFLSRFRSDILEFDLATGQTLESFTIFSRSFFDYLLGQRWGGRCFIPIECFQIIAHKLFVETRRTLPDRVLVLRPEARRIRRE